MVEMLRMQRREGREENDEMKMGGEEIGGGTF